jgi:hypothetical protein
MIQKAAKKYAVKKSCGVLKAIGEAGDLKDQSHLGDPQILDIMTKNNKKIF